MIRGRLSSYSYMSLVRIAAHAINKFYKLLGRKRLFHVQKKSEKLSLPELILQSITTATQIMTQHVHKAILILTLNRWGLHLIWLVWSLIFSCIFLLAKSPRKPGALIWDWMLNYWQLLAIAPSFFDEPTALAAWQPSLHLRELKPSILVTSHLTEQLPSLFFSQN